MIIKSAKNDWRKSRRVALFLPSSSHSRTMFNGAKDQRDMRVIEKLLVPYSSCYTYLTSLLFILSSWHWADTRRAFHFMKVEYRPSLIIRDQAVVSIYEFKQLKGLRKMPMNPAKRSRALDLFMTNDEVLIIRRNSDIFEIILLAKGWDAFHFLCPP